MFFTPTFFSRRDDFSRITDMEIYYGTMFGSAEHYARSLAHEVTAQGPVRVAIRDLDGFTEASFTGQRLHPMRLFVFVLSTHFAGGPSPSAERFHHWLTHLSDHQQDSVHHGESYGTDLTPRNSPSVSSTTQTHGPLLNLVGRGSRLPFSSRTQKRPLEGLQYVVFGIGDSMYLTYNAMAKSVDARLKKLGASRLLPLALGDCSNNLEGSYKAWELILLHRLLHQRKSSLISDIRTASSTAIRRLSKHTPSVAPSAPTPRDSGCSVLNTVDGIIPRAHGPHPSAAGSFALTVRDNFGRPVRLRFQCVTFREAGDFARDLRVLSVRSGTRTCISSFSSRPRSPRIAFFDETPFAEIVPVGRVGDSSSLRSFTASPLMQSTSGIFKVRLLNPEVSYTAVSTLAIFPHNDPMHVDAVADAFNFDLDAEFELYVDESEAGPHTEQHPLPFPTPCTIRTALTEFLELRTVTPEFIRVASGFVVSLDDQSVLEALASMDGSTAYRTQIQDPHKGLLDLIAMAPTLQIPWTVFVNITQPIKPRYFTIASSARRSPRELELAIAFGRPNEPQGLATSFFERMLATPDAAPTPVRGFISISRFKFRDDGVSPMVFIASGVGFAAMRATIQERLMLWAEMASSSRGQSFGSSIPKQLLFLGAADEESIVFLKDLRRWEQQMVVQVHHAYSNDRYHPRRYVQDVVATHIDEITQIIKSSPGARIFVCGRVAMVRRIREIFEADQRRCGSAWFTTVHKSGRFIEEGYQ